jgi:hypothetical protein
VFSVLLSKAKSRIYVGIHGLHGEKILHIL